MSSNEPEWDFEKLFEGVSSPEDLLRKLEPPAEREIVRRASVLRNFDEQVFREFLSQNLPYPSVPTFAKFVSNFNLERVPRAKDVFRVKEEARRSCLDELRSEHQAGGEARRNNEDVFGKLLGYYETLSEASDFDRLAVLVVVDQARARQEFERLYAEADARFDMARCNDLLRVFEARTQLLEEDLRRLCQNKRQYYHARSLFAEEFYQTTAYLTRGAMSGEFIRLLDRRPAGRRWVYQVYATGGLGKTMFVRWLISRCCVPEPRKIPVAKLDFDLLDLNTASQYPHLLLLPIAEQLDQQIERRPFHEAFSSMWDFKPLLDSPTGGERDARRAHLEQSFRRDEAQWRKTALPVFCRTLKEANFTGPIVIAIDTLEEMLLFSKESLANVIRQLRDIHEVCPSLRLVLSGRYDLRDSFAEFPDLRDLFEAQAVNLELKRFTRAEALTYLPAKRGLKEDEEGDLIRAVVEKCAEHDEGLGINPFVLSLLADLVISKDIRTAEDVEALPRAEVAYLIERIVKRIKDDDVRWILRYASVPRRLTFDLLEKVLWPHLLAERVERRLKDSRRKGADGYDQTGYFRHGEASSPQEAWEKLKPFVSAYGWVSWDDDGCSMRLHPDVTIPMRLLLADEDIYPQLHGDAARYFEQRAREVPEQWAEWTCEAVYHHFQLDGPKAAKFWREQMKSKRATTDMAARVRLASEITRRDYVDEKCLPLKRKGGGPVVEMRDLCEAHHEAAVTSIMLTASHEPGTQEYARHWGDARQYLTKLRASLAIAGPAAFKPDLDVEVFIRLASELNKSLPEPESVLALSEKALASTRSLFLKLCLTTQLAEMYAHRDAARAESLFRKALEISGFIRVPAFSPLTVSLRLARWYSDTGRARDALDLYESALKLPEAKEKPDLRRAIKNLMAQSYLSIGWYYSAERLGREGFDPEQTFPASDSDWDSELLLHRLHAHELFRPLDALRRSEVLLRGVTADRRRAALLEQRGHALGQLMQFGEALAVLEQSKELWEAVNDPYGADRARQLRVELQLNLVGNVNEAAVLLDRWDVHGEKRDPERSCQMELLRVRCLYRMGRGGEARQRWLALRESEDVGRSPRSRARVLAAGLVFGVAGDDVVPRLCEALLEIEPPSARLELLSVFGLARGVREGGGAEPLVRLVDWAPEKKQTIFAALIYADLLRFAGQREKAARMLTRTADKALNERNAFALYRVLAAFNQAGFPPPPEVSVYHASFDPDPEQMPAMRRALLLEEVELALRAGALEQSEQALAEATALQPNSDQLTKWNARAAESAARLAEQRGDLNRAEANFEVALSSYERLGDHRAAWRIRELLAVARERRHGIAGASEVAPHQPAERVHTVRLNLAQDSLVVAYESNVGRDRGDHRLSPPVDLLAASLRDRGELFDLTEWMVDRPEHFRQALWDILIGWLPAAAFLQGPRSRELRVEIPATTLAKIPWEAASHGGDGLLSIFRYVYRGTAYGEPRADAVRWLQLAARRLFDLPKLRADGILGQRTRRALRDAGLPSDELGLDDAIAEFSRRLWAQPKPLRALIVGPSFEKQFVSMRGGEGIEGVSLPHTYTRLGFETRAVELDSPAGLLETLAEVFDNFRPHLMHVESSFKTAGNTGQVYIDIDTGMESHAGELSRPEALGVRPSSIVLNDLLARLPASSPRPLVVIEAQRPPGDSATASQLLMRNTFASELFHLGNTCCVVATGLFEHSADRLHTLDGLLGGLSRGASFGDAFNCGCAPGMERAGGRPPTCALFTNSPLVCLIPD